MRHLFLTAFTLIAACKPAPKTEHATMKVATPGEVNQPSAAERVVQLQYDAYNRHDVEAFVGAHAPDVRFYRYPDSLVINGRPALRERFGRLFASAPQVHATIDARITHGDFVVWRETATGIRAARLIRGSLYGRSTGPNHAGSGDS